MEFIDGETLAEYLKIARPLTPLAALPIVRQIAAALDTLHRSGILHRDLKPSNVMLDFRPGPSPRAIVTDFGLAKSEAGESELFESSLNFQAGAPYFMSPEQLRGERPTAASDIYAFGLVVDEMMTRSRAFPAASVQALYYAKLWETPTAPEQRADCLPVNWSDAILRCIDRTPERRFATAQEVIEALQSDPAPAARGTAPHSENRLRRQLRGKRRILAWSAATAFLGLAGIVLLTPPVQLELFDMENATGQASYNYFCRGLTLELARRLARPEGMHVVPLRRIRSATSAGVGRFSFDGKLSADGTQLHLVTSLTDRQRPGAPLWKHDFNAQGDRRPAPFGSGDCHYLLRGEYPKCGYGRRLGPCAPGISPGSPRHRGYGGGWEWQRECPCAPPRPQPPVTARGTPTCEAANSPSNNRPMTCRPEWTCCNALSPKILPLHLATRPWRMPTSR